MSVEWGEHLAVGVTAVEEQHKEMFRQINLLMDAINLGKGADQVIPLLDFLEEYTVDHFRDEEKIMVESSYDKLEPHRLEHEQFRLEMENLRLRVRTEGGTRLNVLMTSRALLHWLVQHIYSADKELADHMREIRGITCLT